MLIQYYTVRKIYPGINSYQAVTQIMKQPVFLAKLILKQKKSTQCKNPDN